MVETKPAVFWSRLLKVLKYHLWNRISSWIDYK
jgi:hypothetical protein